MKTMKKDSMENIKIPRELKDDNSGDTDNFTNNIEIQNMSPTKTNLGKKQPEKKKPSVRSKTNSKKIS